MNKSSRRCQFLIFAILLACLGARLTVYAQNQVVSASLSGTITDPSGAVIPGANVTIAAPEKGISREFVTDNNGRYVFNLLPPTTYTLKVEAIGFGPYKQSGITLEVGQSAQQDVILTVGGTEEQVSVTAQEPLLNTENADLSAEVSSKQVLELPLNLRNIYGLATLNSSVNNFANGAPQGYVAQADQDISFFNFGGGFFGTTAFLLDGIWDTAADWGAVIYVPSVDDVQEFKIQTNSFSAQYGWSTGNVINVVTKSGDNAFHGDAFEFYRNSVFDANGYFNDLYGNPKPSFNRHQFGVSAGAPLRLPKVYKQTDKTFMFGLYEGLRQSSPSSFAGTIPTTPFRNGDFSALLGTSTGQTDALGRPVYPGQIYDPYSTRSITAGQVDPSTGLVATQSGYIRDPFPGNMIGSRINAISAALVKYYPNPSNADTINNFSTSTTSTASSDEYTIRVDHNLTPASRIFGRWSQKYETKVQSAAFYGADDPGGPGNWRPNNRYNGTFGFTHVFNPTTTISWSGGLSRWVEGSNTQGYPFKSSTIGLPGFLDSTSPVFPLINVEGESGLGPTQGNQGAAIRNVGSTSVDLTKVIASHSLAVGYMGVDLQNNFSNLPTTDFAFDHGFTAGPDPSAAAANTGFGFASLLLGTPSSGGTSNSFNPALSKRYQGMYLQDDWKFNRKLTLNLGIRYEIQNPPTERHDRQNYFDFAAANPLGSAVGQTLPGELVFNGGSNRRGLYDTVKTNLAPRLGLVYDLLPKLVVRAGYGIFYPPQFFPGDTNLGAPNDGFSEATPEVTTLDGITPHNDLSNPFPGGLRQPTGNSLGGLQDVGYGTVAVPSTGHNPYVQQMTVGLQYAFTANDVLNASFVNSHGTHLLMADYTHSQLDPKYLSMGDALLNMVPNPFYNSISSSGCGLDQPTITAGQSMQPYPQYCGVVEPLSARGFSQYNAAIVEYNHRLASGLNILASYTFSKFLDNVEGANDWAYWGTSSVRNYYNLAAEKSVDASDTPQSLAVNYIYQLPVGTGKKFGKGFNKATDAVLGGWQISGINTIKSGIPLCISGGANSNLFGGGQRPNIIGNPNAVHRSINEWFNTAAFAAPTPYTFGDVPRQLANSRAPHYNDWDLGIEKWWHIKEVIRAQFRAEMFNAPNHTNFEYPDTNIQDGAFGTIFMNWDPRSVQFAGKIYW